MNSLTRISIHIFLVVPTNIMWVEFEIKTFTDMHVHGDDTHTYDIFHNDMVVIARAGGGVNFKNLG